MRVIACITADYVADKNRFPELEGINGHSHDPSLGAASGNDTAGNIDLRH